jgi:hypothetical protein
VEQPYCSTVAQAQRSSCSLACAATLAAASSLCACCLSQQACKAPAAALLGPHPHRCSPILLLPCCSDSANVFGKVTNQTGFVPYAGEGFALLLPSKWNPSKETDLEGLQLRSAAHLQRAKHSTASGQPHQADCTDIRGLSCC